MYSMDVEKIEQGKIKGYLTVNKRIIVEGGNYHITQRAPGRELIFVEESDYLYFLKLMKETVGKFNLYLFCFCLLPNHVHLFLRIKEKNLSQAMKNLFERYAYYFNCKYKRKGHVFCGRYRASFCNDEKYFLAISLYIHLNPYKAGLCEDLYDYRWSSFRLYAESSNKTFIKFEEILSLLAPNISEARKKYCEIIDEGKKIKGSVLFDRESIKKNIRQISVIVSKVINTRGDIDDLDKLVEDFNLKKRLRGLEHTNAKKYLVEQLLANGYSKQEICETLKVSRMTLHRLLNVTNKV